MIGDSTASLAHSGLLAELSPKARADALAELLDSPTQESRAGRKKPS
jgi:hypothetical protein